MSDPPDVAAGVRLLGLPANPFGPEQAELDPSLPDYPVYTKALQDVRGPRPTLLIGAPGCGKTAAALLLAYDCTYPPANPRESGAFPIYHTPRLDFPPEEARPSQLEALAKAVARVLLDSLASDPNAFLLHEEANQMAIVQLLAYCTGQTGNLVWRLRRAGSVAAGEGGQMLRQVQRLESILPADGPLDEDELIELLGKARPAGLSYTYALIDLSVEPANDEEAVAFAARLGPLFDLTVPLAMAGVYLKAFLPESLFRERDKSWKSERPDAGAIRELLTAAFSDEELQSFCFDNPDLKPVYEEFASGMSKIEKVRRLVEFSERRALLDKLLDKVQEKNRQQYEKFRGRLYREMAGELGAANADSWDEMSLLRPVPITWGQTGMEELLHSRLRWVGYQSLSALCDPEARVLDPDRRLVKAAEGSPRRLVRLGNRLLARVVTHPDEPPLTADDLNYVLGHE